ncbi:MAG: hypothetical protein ACREQI_05375 [Candidatus Binataceae bacterium]
MRPIEAILLCAAIALVAGSAQAQAPAATPAASSKPSASAAAGSPTGSAAEADASAATDPQAVISYLSGVIGWYRHLTAGGRLVTEPSDMAFFSNDQRIAGEIIQLAFAYARAAAGYIEKTAEKYPAPQGTRSAPGALKNGAPELRNLSTRTAQLQAQARDLQKRISDLHERLKAARGRKRGGIESAIAAAEGSLDLVRARIDAVGAMIQFESGRAGPERATDLDAQIDQLERSLPLPAGKGGAIPAAPPLQVAEPSGIIGLAESLFALQRKFDELDGSAAFARSVADRIGAVRQPLILQMREIDREGDALARAGGPADVQSLRARKRTFEALLARHKLVTAALLPLSEQLVLFGQYRDNLARWQAAVERRSAGELRRLAIRAIALAAVLILIFAGAALWRRLANRYVTDIRRRGQALAARRFAIWLLVVAIVLYNFSTEIGSVATVLGFAAAGIALALQNVILSVAGYFFLIGRFGIKVGDRVELGSVTGDVIDIGLVKLSLMELGGVGAVRQPTGRVVVFSNSIVFQPNGNFFKQAPGASFIWNEVRLTLAADCDFRLAEKRILEAVEGVYAGYRERVERDWRNLQLELNMILEPPKPQSLLNLGPAGLTVIVRYPAETYSAPQIADEVARRVLDAIAREPGLRIATTGAANIQAEPIPAAGSGA